MSDPILAVNNAYLLVDGALVSEAVSHLVGDVETWLYPVYVGGGTLIGPLIVDIDAIQQSEQLDAMMSVVNAMSPQLHLSYIETALSAAELTSHLQQFILIRTFDGRLCNLRLSDCVVLSMLKEVFSSAQWATLTGPLSRWSMHTREGQTLELHRVISSELPPRLPLILDELQLARMAELGAPDVMLANIRAIRHGEALAGSRAEQHHWASEARQRWKDAANSDEIVLRWITAAAVDTKGRILSRSGLSALLADGNRERIKSELATDHDGHR